MSDALSVADLRVAFGEFEVFADVSFSVEAGSAVALVGPNGSGKSTLLRAVAGIQRSTGTVSVAGDAPRTVGYLPQNPRFRAGFTARETVETYADLLPDPPDPDAALARVGLGSEDGGLGAADRRVEALSGGMRRLLGIAVALLGDPPLVVLDEPTSDLDPVMSAHVFDVVDDLTADGTAVLLATHDDRSVTRTDRVLAVQDGAVTEPELDRTADDPLAALFEVPEPTAAVDGGEEA
ncbi:ATP-binding cassette domain-containing protein [Halorarius halobius]|uniref:ATP-binding cassette domain-containing protein n=1 Tax=Halorarius halobius TaxID=2962671 RepID=UPI0020CEF3CC|nr:ATP-binding cassette domain-containing protein [Halorarius halobius]